MKKISVNCAKLNKELKINQEESIFNQLISQNIPIASSCKGKGVCKWCKVVIINGEKNLNPKNSLEEKASLEPNERLLCQIKSDGDLKIDTSYW
jgi:ferredoxin